MGGCTDHGRDAPDRRRLGPGPAPWTRPLIGGALDQAPDRRRLGPGPRSEVPWTRPPIGGADRLCTERWLPAAGPSWPLACRGQSWPPAGVLLYNARPCVAETCVAVVCCIDRAAKICPPPKIGPNHKTAHAEANPPRLCLFRACVRVCAVPPHNSAITT